MKNWKLGFGIFLGFGILILGFYLLGCSSLQPYFNQANTDMKSSTFSSLAASGLSATGVVTIDGFSYWAVTPAKITGKVASVFFPINQTEDEGIVVYGYYRPDLATSLTELKDFDLSTTTRLSGIISQKPGYKGGDASIILMQYGYFNVYFTQGSPEAERIIRFCYATTGPYTKGDILIKYTSSDDFKWLNADTGSLESTRVNPVMNSTIKNWVDPSHPTEVFFPLMAKVTPAVSLTGSLVENNNLTFTLDFDYADSLLFEGITTQAEFNNLTSAQLIGRQGVSSWTDRSFMRQMRTPWKGVESADPGVNCTVTVVATPR